MLQESLFYGLLDKDATHANYNDDTVVDPHNAIEGRRSTGKPG